MKLLFKEYLILCILLAITILPANAVQYKLRDICPFRGVYSVACDISSSGQAVGYCGSQAFIWSNDDGLTYLGDLGGGYSVAWSINDRGEVVGTSKIADGTEHAFYWSKDTGMIDIGAQLFGPGESSARFINNSGQILLYPPDVNWRRPVLWDPVLGIKSFGTMGSGHVIAYDMNNNGEVVGFYNNTYPVNSPFIWDIDHGMRNLSTSFNHSAEVFAISDNGLIAGISILGYGTHPFIWDSENGFVDLGIIDGYRDSDVYGINNKGQIVGEFSYGSRMPAFVWDKDSGFQLLPDGGSNPYAPFSQAFGINDNGCIAGCSDFGQGSQDTHAVIWEPVPEPSTALPIVTGITGALFLRKKHRPK